MDNQDTQGYEVSELVCLKCLNRWIGVYPSDVPLKNVECKCGAVGFVIKTGQLLPEESECYTCEVFDGQKGKCKLNLSGVQPCDYKRTIAN